MTQDSLFSELNHVRNNKLGEADINQGESWGNLECKHLKKNLRSSKRKKK